MDAMREVKVIKGITDWREFIDVRGINETCHDLRVSREIVRLWVKEGRVPAGDNLKNIVKIASGELNGSDFATFVNTLTADLLGIPVCPYDIKRAVNE